MTNKIELEFSSINYEGSKIFSSLADHVGLSVDLTNFLITQGLALILASLFRSYLHPSKVSASVRHAYGLVIGLLFGYFCFGQQAIHIAGLPAACYIVLRTQSPQFVQRTVMVVALVYLSCIHLHRQYINYGSYTVDITGPLMIITQKVISLAFSVHDGFQRETRQLTKSQQYHMIEKVPSPLEYFAFVLNFPSLLAGPLILYRDYKEFVEGCNIIKRSNSNGKADDSTKKIMQEPSPVKAVVKKVIACLVCAYIYVRFINMYPIRSLKDKAFIDGNNMFYNLWYTMMCTTTVRFKYYFAWLLADAICNNAGLGFNGFDSDATPKWDLFTNIYVIPLELGTNFRDWISNWNFGTNVWLRMVVYERAPKKYATILTFALSAVWHGFYPGYYITFATGALFVQAARKGRRMFRHHFQHTEVMRIFYDVITCIMSRFFITYTTFPFVLLELEASLHLYLRLFMCLHFIGLLTIFVLPKIIRGSPNERSSSKPAIKADSDGKPLITDAEPKNDELVANDKKVDVITMKKHHSESNNEPEELSNSNSSCSSYNNSMNDISDKNPRKTDTNYLLKDLISKEVSKIKGETDNLSNLLKEKIEAANIEGLIDKTVTGIVELKDDLMKMNEPEVYSGATEGLRKRNLTGAELELNGSTKGVEGVDAFLKKEIDAIKEANVIPAVLNNGHAK